MKKLTCEMCGSNDLIKQDGVFVCQYCGTKYTVEEAKKMMIDGTVDVQGTVKVDVSDKVNNLYIVARRAKDAGDSESAAKYYEMITFENPRDWECLFYYNYFMACQTNLCDMENSITRLSNSLDDVFELIYESDKAPDEKWNIAQEIIIRIDTLSESLIDLAKSHYRKCCVFDDLTTELEFASELYDRARAVAELQKTMARLLDKYFPDNSAQEQVSYLKSYIENYLLVDTLNENYVKGVWNGNSNELSEAETKIKAIDPSYVSLINNIGSNAATEDTNSSSTNKNKTEKIVNSAGIGCCVGGAVSFLLTLCFQDSIMSLLENDLLFVVILLEVIPFVVGAIVGKRIGKAMMKK